MRLLVARLRNMWLKAKLTGRELHPLARTNLAALDGLDAASPARDHRYVVLDLETTGLDPRRDRVISVGALRLVEGRIRLGEIFSEFINPGSDVPVESIKIHGIVPGKLLDARPAWEVFDDFLSFIGSDILVAHYAPFDVCLMNRVMRRRYGFELQNMILDTVELARAALIRPDPYGINVDGRQCSMEALTQRFGMQMHERHTALGDALTTALIFQRLLDHMEKSGWNKLGDLIRMAGYAP